MTLLTCLMLVLGSSSAWSMNISYDDVHNGREAAAETCNEYDTLLATPSTDSSLMRLN